MVTTTKTRRVTSRSIRRKLGQAMQRRATLKEQLASVNVTVDNLNTDLKQKLADEKATRAAGSNGNGHAKRKRQKATV